MAIGIILGILFFAALVGGIVITSVSYSKNYGYYSSRSKTSNKGIIIGIVVIVVALLLLITIPGSFHTVQTGEVAVIKTLGEAKEVKGPGTSFDFWMIDSYEYIDTKTQELTIETMAYSSDAQLMTISMTVQYQAMGDKAIDIVRDYGNLEALTSRITSIATEQPKSVVSNRAAMDIIANRSIITPEIEAAIKQAIGEKYYITINTVTVTNIDFSDAFEQAVEDKMIAEQAKLKAEYENEKKIAQAEAEAAAKLKAAEAEIEIAKAEAEALKIAAEAEAAANKTIAESLTGTILEKIYADKWNGELPDVIGSGDYILPGDVIG